MNQSGWWGGHIKEVIDCLVFVNARLDRGNPEMVSACFLDHPVKPDDDPLAGVYPHGYPSTIISGHFFFSDLTFKGKKKRL